MQFSLLQPLSQLPLAFVDVETTGVSAAWGRVIEVGIVRMEGGRVTGEYQRLVDPRRRIGPAISALTGITQKMVAGQPTFARQLDQMLPLLNGAVLLGHNVRFDLSFLHREFLLAHRPMAEVLGRVPVLDTVRMARRRFGRGGNGLQILSRRLGIEPVGAHRALADAHTTARIFQKLIEPAGGWGMTLCDVMLMQGGPMDLLGREPAEPQPAS